MEISETLKNFLGIVSDAVDKGAEAYGSATKPVDIPGTVAPIVGDKVLDTTGSPAAATAAHVATELVADPTNLIPFGKAFGAAGLAVGGTLGAIGKSLGEAMKSAPTTSRVLNELSAKATDIPKETILEKLKMQTLGKDEKAIFNNILDQHQEDSIPADTLVDMWKKATNDFTLSTKELTGPDSYASYGLNNIRPNAQPGSYSSVSGKTPGLDAKTHVYQVPENGLSEGTGHFPNEANYYAHSREFTENGIPHVVEIQSDLAQHLKSLTPEKKAILTDAVDSLKQQVELQGQIVDKSSLDGASLARNLLEHKDALDKVNPDYIMLLENDIAKSINSKLKSSKWFSLSEQDKLTPAEFAGQGEGNLLKLIAELSPDKSNLDKSLISNEVRSIVNGAFHDRLSASQMKIAEHQAALSSGGASDLLSPILGKTWPRKVIQEDLARYAAEGKTKARYATADTVAKVEGWPTYLPDAARTAVDKTNDKTVALSYYKERLTNEAGSSQSKIDKIPDKMKQATAAMDKAWSKGQEFQKPEHALIWDRYETDITNYLKSEGGKPYKDSLDHTWIEVPIKAGKFGAKPKQFGRITPEVAASLAAGGAAASVIYNRRKDDPK